ncbi:hypothetical protein COLO4_21433 [Corchorus olitorius]|uniref:Uncharacterized protein n=1 Tax=Corchorus olitorius TaxID=93759 RepID=A0A1R3ITA2_9ROSI|nr:hypothetical protein COLO4_21433 [Corchorus olitorius]
MAKAYLHGRWWPQLVKKRKRFKANHHELK